MNIRLDQLDGTNGFRLVGADVGDVSGASVVCAGDVNGDGSIDDRPAPFASTIGRVDAAQELDSRKRNDSVFCYA